MTLYDLATRHVGIKEVPGIASNELILTMLQLDNKWPEGDHVPWCSAFINYIAWALRLPRSKSLRARSWLKVGVPITLENAEPQNDIVILTRGKGEQPGPDIIDAPGHVGLFAGRENNKIYILGGNQSNEVNVKAYDVERILGIRRIK
ncbi:TIGR02594 family protein [Algivirga pacifica]